MKCMICKEEYDTIQLKTLKKFVCHFCVQKKIEKKVSIKTIKSENLDTNVTDDTIRDIVSKMDELKVEALKAYRIKNIRLFNDCQKQYEKLHKDKLKFYKKNYVKK